jgi:hypothetical protein
MNLAEYSDDHTPEANDEFLQAVLSNGGKIVLPWTGELLLDFDTQEQADKLFERIDKFHRTFKGSRVTVTKATPSASGPPHQHVILLVEMRGEPVKFDNITAIALQMYFGSDANRELHGICRTLNNCSTPTIFVEGIKWHEALRAS